MKRGLSLLEVLISMFVLTIGLLSVIALVPVGQSEMVKGGIADRTFAMGQAVFKDAKIRGLLRPLVNRHGPAVTPPVAMWWWHEPGNPAAFDVRPGLDPAITPYVVGRIYITADGDITVATTTTDLVSQPVALDPLAYLENGSTVVNPGAMSAKMFPYDAPYANGDPTAIRRLTFRAWATPGSPVLTADNDNSTTPLNPSNPTTRLEAGRGLAREVFYCHDDLLLDVPGDPEQAPRSMFFGENLTPTNPIKRMFEPKYSWIMTLVPTGSGKLSLSTVIYRVRTFEMDIDPSQPVYNERSVVIRWTGGGYGGGEVELESPVRAKLGLKGGSWLLATGQEVTDHNGDGTTDKRLIAKWYKVRGADQTVDANDAIAGTVPPYTQIVRLDGADWAAGAEAPLLPRAAIFEGVVGVYEKTVTLERSSLWMPN